VRRPVRCFAADLPTRYICVVFGATVYFSWDWEGRGKYVVTGLELVAGYLVAWAARKAARVGKRLDEEADGVIDAELDRLHEVVTEKLGLDPAIQKLDLEASQGQQPSDRTLRRVQDAVEEAAEEDPRFEALLGAALSSLERAQGNASPVAWIDLRGAKGIQVGNYNSQTNTFS
jgi:hypothetical protein